MSNSITNTKKTFRSLSNIECMAIYEPIRQNAKRHFSAAQLLADHGDFANGISHLILGTEELLKSAILLLQGLNFPVRDIPNYDKVFYQHIPRHNVLMDCYSVYIFLNGIFKKSQKNQNLQLVQFFKNVIASAHESRKQYDWWSNADSLKQKGFYCDYNEHGLLDPLAFKEEDWLRAHDNITMFSTDITEMMVTLTNAEQDKLTEYQNDFIVSEFNLLLSESINRKR